MVDKYNQNLMSSDILDDDEWTRWSTEIALAKREQEKWYKRSKEILNFYTNYKLNINGTDAASSSVYESSDDVDFNCLWMVQQTVAEAIYGRTPKPIIKPKIQSTNDDKADNIRDIACNILSKVIKFFINDPDNKFDDEMRAARDDFMLLAKGQAWVQYTPINTTNTVVLGEGEEVPNDVEVKERKVKDKKTKKIKIERYYEDEYLDTERVDVTYINWKNFLQSPAERQTQVRWNAKRVYLTKDEFKKAFPHIDINKVAITLSRGDDSTALSSTDTAEDDAAKAMENRILGRIEVWEIWDKPSKSQIFYSPNYKEDILQKNEMPVEFNKLAPCPYPMMGTHTNDSIVPVSNYNILSYTINEVDTLTQRIEAITSGIKVILLYDSTIVELKDVFNQLDASVIGLENWKRFKENGGFEGCMQAFPINDYINALEALTTKRDQVLQDFYTLQGFTSIMRGEAVANESASAQQARARFSDLRLSSTQKEMQRFVRDVISLMSEVICNKFEKDTILTIAGYKEPKQPQIPMPIQTGLPMGEPLPQGGMSPIPPQGIPQNQPPVPQQQGVQQPMPPQPNPEMEKYQKDLEEWDNANEAVDLLRNRLMKEININIETDSTLAINGDAEKQDRVEFVNTVINALNSMVSIAGSNPEFVPIATEAIQFLVDVFPSSESMGSEINKALKEYQEKVLLQSQQPQQPNPMLLEVQMKQQIEQARLQLEQMKVQGEAQQASQDAQMKFQIKQFEVTNEARNREVEMQMNQQKIQSDFQLAIAKLQSEIQLMREKYQLEAQLQGVKLEQDKQLQLNKTDVDAQVKLYSAQAKQQAEMAAKQMAYETANEAQMQNAIIKAQVEDEKARLKTEADMNRDIVTTSMKNENDLTIARMNAETDYKKSVTDNVIKNFVPNIQETGELTGVGNEKSETPLENKTVDGIVVDVE